MTERDELSELHARLAGLLASGRARLLVDELLTQSSLKKRIARASYMHPNGFRKLVLSTFEDERGFASTTGRPTVRPRRRTSTTIGGRSRRRWSSARFRSTLLTFAEGRDAMQRFVFEPNGPGQEHTMSLVGVATLAVSHLSELGPGSSYVIDARQLHQIRARPGTVSLMLSGPPQRDRTDVFRSPGSAAQTRRQPLLSVSQVRESARAPASRPRLLARVARAARVTR